MSIYKCLSIQVNLTDYASKNITKNSIQFRCTRRGTDRQTELTPFCSLAPMGQQLSLWQRTMLTAEKKWLSLLRTRLSIQIAVMAQRIDSTMPSSNSSNNMDNLTKLDLPPATLEALKTLSSINPGQGIEKLSNCDKLTASLEQIRANKNMKLFEKLDKIRQDFSGLNHKISKMEESIIDLKELTSNLVKSLPSD